MKKILMIFIILITACSSFYAQKIVMRLNLEEGKEYELFDYTSLTSTQELPGGSMVVDMQNKERARFLVTGKSGNGYNVEARYSDMEIGMNIPGMDQQLVTELNKTLAKTGDLFDKIPAKLYLTDKGVFENLNDFDRVTDSIMVLMSGESEIMQELLREHLSSLKDEINAPYLTLPEKEPAPGDRWEIRDTTAATDVMGTILSTTYTYEGETDSTYLISAVSEIVSTDEPVERPGLGKVNYKMRGKEVVTLEYDKKTFWIISGKGKQSMEGKMTIPPGAKFPDGLEIPMKNTTVLEINGYLPE